MSLKINIKLNLKNLIVAIFKRKSEALGEIIDESIEEIEDNRKKDEDNANTEEGQQG